MVVLELRGGQKYRVLNKTEADLEGYEEGYFTPSGDFIGVLESMYRMPMTCVQSFPYWRRDMGKNTKFLTTPLDNNLEYVGIQRIPKSDIFLSFDFKRTDIRNPDDLRAGIEEILLAHHKDWQEKRIKQGRDRDEMNQRISHMVRHSI